MSNCEDLTGYRFGKLTVIERMGKSKQGHILWLCKCDCGETTTSFAHRLKSGKKKSCGCLYKEERWTTHYKHGGTNERLYRVWTDMHTRCNNPNDKAYKNYGARGISICEEWNNYETFRIWAIKNGYQPNSKSGVTTLDRIDVNGNYCPENCRWVSYKEQNNNRRNNFLLTYNGKTQTAMQWSEELGIKYSTLYARIKTYKWPVQKAFEYSVGAG